MAYAIDAFNGDGSRVEFDVTFDFISRDDVEVTRIAGETSQLLTVIVTGSPTGDEFVWDTDEKIKVGTAPAVGEKLVIRRDTPEDKQVVEWSDGSYIIADDLNTADLQLLYLIQELTDDVKAIVEEINGELIKYLGGIDLTTDPAPTNPRAGDFYINTGSGVVLDSWTGIGGNNVVGSEQVVYNGTINEWQIFPVPGTGVSKIIAGTNVTIDPTSGLGEVTINASGGGGTSNMPTGGGTDEIFYENDQTVTTDYTISDGQNAGSFGPVTVDESATVTVGDGETWTVVGASGSNIDPSGFWSRSNSGQVISPATVTDNLYLSRKNNNTGGDLRLNSSPNANNYPRISWYNTASDNTQYEIYYSTSESNPGLCFEGGIASMRLRGGSTLGSVFGGLYVSPDLEVNRALIVGSHITVEAGNGSVSAPTIDAKDDIYSPKIQIREYARCMGFAVVGADIGITPEDGVLTVSEKIYTKDLDVSGAANLTVTDLTVSNKLTVKDLEVTGNLLLANVIEAEFAKIISESLEVKEDAHIKNSLLVGNDQGIAPEKGHIQATFIGSNEIAAAKNVGDGDPVYWLRERTQDSYNDLGRFYYDETSDWVEISNDKTLAGKGYIRIKPDGDLQGSGGLRLAQGSLEADDVQIRQDGSEAFSVKTSINNMKACFNKLKTAVSTPNSSAEELRLSILEALETITEESY